MTANSVMDLILRHKTCRQFTSEPVSKDTLEAILGCALRASTSSALQVWSVISVTDPLLRKELKECASGQSYVESAPIFLVWCADFTRVQTACEKHKGHYDWGTAESAVVGAIDAALAAQNAAIAAESLGLGIVYIGALRNQAARVSACLKLPQGVFPLFGMCIGHPVSTEGLQRPRIPLPYVHFENGYKAQLHGEALDAVDAAYGPWTAERKGTARPSSWSLQVAQTYGGQSVRENTLVDMQAQGLLTQKIK